MKKIILCRGLPASGKSTWAKEQLLKGHGAWVRVNKDDIRSMAHAKWSKSNEKITLALRDALISESLEAGRNVIVDDTNLSNTHYNRIKQLVNGNATVEYKDFLDISVEECIKRDLNRPVSVGEKVIRKMYNQFLRPAIVKPVFDSNLPSCVICDMDGTLSLLGNRNPYEASSCHLDLPNIPVVGVVNKLIHSNYDESRGESSFNIVVFSGRQGSSDVYEKTDKWLHKHLNLCLVNSYHLHLRKDKDQRPDSVIKEELYNQFVKDKYNVQAVFDDRLSVCKLWHSLGLPLFRVGDPEADF